MSKKQTKAYAVVVKVKPHSEGGVKYSVRSFKGVAFAFNPSLAKEQTIEIVLKSFEDYDGSSITKPLITREMITVTKCELFGDFIAGNKQNEHGNK